MKHTNYQLVFENRGTYLYARITGEDSFAAALSYWNEIADKVRELGHTRLLIHEALMGDVSETEIYDLIMDLLASGLTDIQIAFFDENRNDAVLNAFAHSLANSKGASVRVFRALEAAKDWIES